MKALIICSFNHGHISTFIKEQVDSINRSGIETKYFLIKERGLKGYLKHIPLLYKQISVFKPNLIHAHFGLSGLFATLQNQVPVIVSFHGSDINYLHLRFLSKITIKRSAWSIFVSRELSLLANAKRNYSIISCGIDLSIFHPINKIQARHKLGIYSDDKLVLFSGAFNNKVKNYQLAYKAINKIKKEYDFNHTIKIIELKKYTRDQVNLLINACDVALLTSISEGSPNFIKEAMACNCPIVATDVGDIRGMFGETMGCFLTSFQVDDVCDKLKIALNYADQHPNGTNGRDRIMDLGLESGNVADKIIDIYKQVISL